MEALSNPLMDRVIPYPSVMARRAEKRPATKAEESTSTATAKLFAANLEALMSATPELKSNPKLAQKTGLSTASISRLRNAQGNANLETLEAIAHAFHMEPWQLLVPHMEPRNPPALQPLTEQERRLYERLREVAKEINEGR